MIMTVKNVSLRFGSTFLLATALAVSLFPSAALAQTRTVQWYLESITLFFNNTIIPLFFTIAILFLFVNVTKYFVIEASDTYQREEAKRYMLYAVIALVFITSIWGVINLVTSALNIDSNIPVCPDYLHSGGGGCDTVSPTAGNPGFNGAF